MQPSQSQSGSMDSNSLNFKSIVKTLEVVVKHQQNEQKKANCVNVLQKFIDSRSSTFLKDLDKENQLRLVQIRTMLKLYRNAFERITEKEPYTQFKIPDGRIAQYLLNMQQKIDPKDYKTSYLRAITIKKKQFNWPKEFIQDWMKALDQERAIEEQKNKQKQLERSQSIKNQPLPQSLPVQNASLQSFPSHPAQNPLSDHSTVKPEEKKPVQKSGQKSSEKLPGQRPEKKVKKEENGEKVQKEKKGAKQKKEADDSSSSDNETAKQVPRKKAQKQARDKMERYEKPKQPKNRVKALMEYLASRRDFASISSSQHKLKEMAQFLNQNLEKFMKHHLTNLIEVSKLRNRRHQTLASSGNEFSYYSKEGYAPLKTINHLQVPQEPARMLKLNYRSKFEMYSMLRTREEMLEEALLREYGSKKDSQNNKTSDKRLWEYLLRPNHVVQKAEQYMEMEETKADRLSIEIAHIKYLFQAHKFIRNSWLMINCYNS